MGSAESLASPRPFSWDGHSYGAIANARKASSEVAH